MIDAEDLDGADRAYLATMVPEGGMAVAMCCVVAYLDEDGKDRLRFHTLADSDVQASGMLATYAHKILADARAAQVE